MGIMKEWLFMSGRIDKHEGHGVLKGKKMICMGEHEIYVWEGSEMMWA